MKGFTLYMARAVLSGRGDALVELGWTNSGLLGPLLPWGYAPDTRDRW
jgi:pyruvate dehydrogenase (quinone)/pyruvate oxidase